MMGIVQFYSFHKAAFLYVAAFFIHFPCFPIHQFMAESMVYNGRGAFKEASPQVFCRVLEREMNKHEDCRMNFHRDFIGYLPV